MEVCFPHRTTGILHFDPKKGTKHEEAWWALLVCDDGIPAFYGWLLKKHGIATDFNKLWGSHVSVIKGQEPEDKTLWGKTDGTEVEFWYTNQLRWDNGLHAWLDVFSPQMSLIREEMGLPAKCYYHLTIGRLK